MKSVYAILTTLVACNALVARNAQAQAPALAYKDIVHDAAQVGTFEHGNEDALKSSSVGRTVALNLKPFPKSTGSSAFYVDIKDGIAFTCAKKDPKFRGGNVTAKILNHEDGEEETHFFELENCTKSK